MATHHDGQVLAQPYYSGTNERERPTVVTLIRSQHLTSDEFTLDALYLIPAPLELIYAD